VLPCPISVHAWRSTRSPCPLRPTGEWREGCRAWLVPEAVHEPVQGPAQNRRLSMSISNHADFCAIAAARAASASRWSRSSKEAPFLGSAAVVSLMFVTIQKSHAECPPVGLNQFEQPFPYAELRPADEKLCRPPPRTQFSGDTPPFRAILMTPENCCYRPPQIMGGVARRRSSIRCSQIAHVSSVKVPVPSPSSSL
jgi:hypothetical protein